MNTKHDKILIIGVGNEILTDDGIGPKLVDSLKSTFLNQKIEYDKVCLGGMELLEYIQGYDTVIFIDAIKTKDGVPGAVYHFTPDDFKETLHLSNLHDISFLNAISLGRKLGFHIPGRIEIIAVEIVEDLVFNENFTPVIAARYDTILAEVKVIVEHCLGRISTGQKTLLN